MLFSFTLSSPSVFPSRYYPYTRFLLWNMHPMLGIHNFLDEMKDLCLGNNPHLTNILIPVKFHRNSYFYTFNLHSYANFSSQLVHCMPSPFSQFHCTILSTLAHPYTIQIVDALSSFFFIPFSGKLWNSLFLSKYFNRGF